MLHLHFILRKTVLMSALCINASFLLLGNYIEASEINENTNVKIFRQEKDVDPHGRQPSSFFPPGSAFFFQRI